MTSFCENILVYHANKCKQYFSQYIDLRQLFAIIILLVIILTIESIEVWNENILKKQGVAENPHTKEQVAKLVRPQDRGKHRIYVAIDGWLSMSLSNGQRKDHE